MTFQMFRPFWLVLLGMGVIAALLMSPATRWLVRGQLIADGLTPTSTAAQVRHGEDARRRYAAAHPYDVQIQLAAADEASNPAAHVAVLRALLRSFPTSPAIYATMLRYETAGGSESKTAVYVDRPDEEYYLSNQSPPQSDKDIPPSAASLAAFDADATAGEHLDPDNAFFPLMHAAGLFAGRQDTQAQEAVLRAGRATAWREYITDETTGSLRLADAAYGHSPALSHVAIAAAVLFPHYSSLRAVARIATAEAAQAETAGQPARGMAIRHALLRCGGLMRANATDYIGSLVGIAITAIATARPNGVLLPGGGTQLTGEERAERRLQAFAAYADARGDRSDALLAQTENADGQTIRSMWEKAESRSVLLGPQLLHLGAWWLTDLVVLVDTTWLIALAAVAAGCSRLPSIRARQPLKGAAANGIYTALFLPTTFTSIAAIASDTSYPILFVATLVTIGGVAFGLLGYGFADPDGRRRIRQDSHIFIPAFVITVLVYAAAIAIVGRQLGSIFAFFSGFWPSSSVSDSSGDIAWQTDLTGLLTRIIFPYILPLMLPLLMLIIFSIVGRARRIPASVAIVDGFQFSSIPVACTLLLLYGGLALGTLRQERTVDAGVQQMIQHEGPYYASLAGVIWPGPPKP